MSSKINNTYGAGYRMDHDFDARKFEEEKKKAEGGGRKKRGRDPTTGKLEGQGPSEVKRQTWMLPFTFICDHCNRRNSKGSKLYANVTKLPKEEWYLGQVAVYQLQIRCIFCPGFVRFQTDPENGTYLVTSGGKRIEGDWKELQDKEKQKEEEKASLLSDTQAKHSDMLLESQRNAEQAENLAKFLGQRSKQDRNETLARTLAAVKAAKAPSAVVTTSNSGLPTFDLEDEGSEDGAGESDTGSDASGEDETFRLEWEEAQQKLVDTAHRAPEAPHPEPNTSGAGDSSSSEDSDADVENPFLVADDLLEGPSAPRSRKAAPEQKKAGGALSRLML